MADESDPPRKFYDFKPKEFENVNRVPPPADATPAAPPPEPGAVDRGPVEVKDMFLQARLGGRGPLLSPQGRPAGPRNDVHAILEENLARANAAGLNDLAPLPERPSKRQRAYLVGVILGNALFVPMTAFTAWHYFGAATPSPKVALEFGGSISALVLFNIGLWWMVWHRMDDD